MNKPSIHTLLQDFESAQATRKLPDFGPGDTVVVNVKVKEGNRERVQAYEGVVIGKKNAGLNSAFTVRKISHGFQGRLGWQCQGARQGGCRGCRVIQRFA